MLKYTFLLLSVLLVYQFGYSQQAKLIKITPADTVLAVPAGIKKQFIKVINGKEQAPVHLVLAGADKKTIENSSRWLAGTLNMQLYRVDLSQVVSKYIGETEKNIKRIFESATKMNGILLFDEADALFGIRTEVKDAHDKYANQEVSYLLQRIEEHPGMVILACHSEDCIRNSTERKLVKITAQ